MNKRICCFAATHATGDHRAAEMRYKPRLETLDYGVIRGTRGRRRGGDKTVNGELQHRIARLLIITAAVIIAGAAGAAQDADFESCANLESDSERLACFDAIAGRARGGSEAAVPGGAAAAEVSIPEVVAPAKPAEAPAASQADTSAERVRPPDDPVEPAEIRRTQPREYTATVVAIRERPHGQMVVTLDNGEAWSEQFASRAFLVDVGDSVTMKKGMLSSRYQLVAPGGRVYRMTRIDQ